MSILKWLGVTDDGSGRTDNQLHEIEQALEAHGPERARYLACFAYILTRAAKADHHVSDGEARMMEQIVAERAGVGAEQAALIVRIARDAGHSRGTDDYLITREFERIASREEKLALLDDQVRSAVPPLTTEVASAVNVTVGAGGRRGTRSANGA